MAKLSLFYATLNKIVFVTAKVAIDDKMTAYQQGIEDYITKAIDRDFVLQIVERLTSKRSDSRAPT